MQASLIFKRLLMSCVNNTDVNLLFLVRIIVHCVNEACSKKGFALQQLKNKEARHFIHVGLSPLNTTTDLFKVFFNKLVQR